MSFQATVCFRSSFSLETINCCGFIYLLNKFLDKTPMELLSGPQEICYLSLSKVLHIENRYLETWVLKNLLIFFTRHLLGSCYLHEGSHWKKLLVLWVGKTDFKIRIHFISLLGWMLKNNFQVSVLKFILTSSRVGIGSGYKGNKCCRPPVWRQQFWEVLRSYPLMQQWKGLFEPFQQYSMRSSFFT